MGSGSGKSCGCPGIKLSLLKVAERVCRCLFSSDWLANDHVWIKPTSRGDLAKEEEPRALQPMALRSSENRQRLQLLLLITLNLVCCDRDQVSEEAAGALVWAGSKVEL